MSQKLQSESCPSHCSWEYNNVQYTLASRQPTPRQLAGTSFASSISLSAFSSDASCSSSVSAPQTSSASFTYCCCRERGEVRQVGLRMGHQAQPPTLTAARPREALLMEPTTHCCPQATLTATAALTLAAIPSTSARQPRSPGPPPALPSTAPL